MSTTFILHGDISVLTIDHPPVNALSQAVRQSLVDAVARLTADDAVSALIIACAGRTFCAGADIREFGLPPSEPFLPDVVETIARSPKPVIAAIHGTALGGGLEIALACHYRVAALDAKLGLPEVKLGLMPGARGSQLLPRLVGVAFAMDMICTGTPVGAGSALDAGLVDAIASGDLVEGALTFARVQRDAQVAPLWERPVPAADPATIDAYLAKHARKLRGLDAPPAIARAIRAAIEYPYAQAAAIERAEFLKLRDGPQSKALRHVFAAEREAIKFPELTGATPRAVETVGVIGAGTMGSGIAIAFLAAGYAVILLEQQTPALERGMAQIRKAIDANIASGRMARAAADAAMARLHPSLAYSDLAACDLIVEAAFETIEVKQAIFAQIAQMAKPGAIFATNTSYLDVDAIAEAGHRPADTLGLHFFSPANIMKLLEIVRGAKTSPDVIATALIVAKRLGKVAVVSGNAWGFIGNRMLAVRRREAEGMLLQGASPYAIDRVIETFGLPMGPFRIGDLAGLDLGWSAQTSTGSTVRERLNEAGRRGQKTGKGFYDYDAQRQPAPSDEALAILADFARDQGVTPREFSDDEILARLLWPMVDEGATLLGEGIARRSGDIDTVWINGYGWPSWTGGPMFHASQVGYNRVVAVLRELGYMPGNALLNLAASAE